MARKFDHDLGKLDPTVAVRDIDFAGLFRTPFITLQSAFFKRILPQINFMIAGPTSVDMYVRSLRRVSNVPLLAPLSTHPPTHPATHPTTAGSHTPHPPTRTHPIHPPTAAPLPRCPAARVDDASTLLSYAPNALLMNAGTRGMR